MEEELEIEAELNQDLHLLNIELRTKEQELETLVHLIKEQ